MPSLPPIRSLLVDDESLARLDAFMIALGERIDAIQEAESTGACDELGKAALELAAEATALGLPPLAAAARLVAASSRAGVGHALHAGVVELTEVVTRVRLGHRGSGAL